MTSVVEDVCKLEKQYGSILKVPEDNLLLMKIRLSLKKVPEDSVRIEYSHEYAQKMLDKGYPKRYVAEQIGVSGMTVSHEIAKGNLSIDKWKKNRVRMTNHRFFDMYFKGKFVAHGDFQELSKQTGINADTIQRMQWQNGIKFYRLVLRKEKYEWVKIGG